MREESRMRPGERLPPQVGTGRAGRGALARPKCESLFFRRVLDIWGYDMQFSLRWLLGSTTIFALVFSFAQIVGYVVAFGTALGALTFAWSICGNRKSRLALVRSCVGVLALVLLWFMAVDWLWFTEDCGCCHTYRDVTQYRVFGVVVCESQGEHKSIMAKIAEDLGAPCAHKFSRCQRQRWWGLVLCDPTSSNGVVRIIDSEWYDEEMRHRVRSLGRSSPSLAHEYHRNVLVKFDRTYWSQFCGELRRETGTKRCHRGQADGSH